VFNNGIVSAAGTHGLQQGAEIDAQAIGEVWIAP